jgi:tRNA threonylcarbamoyladenosine biosynthesis protein TsaE
MPEAEPLKIDLADEVATLALGARLAAQLRAGNRIYLSGELGAGKTTLTRGLLRALGFAGRVKSPSYSLVELYTVSSLNLYHFDFYRFSDPEEWQEAGFRDFFNEANICLVEWPEMARDLLPTADVKLTLAITPQATRIATLMAGSAAGRQMLAALR